jgi:hypothetical protein
VHTNLRAEADARRLTHAARFGRRFYNRKFFILFLFWTVLSCLYFVVAMAARGAPAVARLVLSPDGSATPLKFMAFIMDCALAFAVSGFLCFHLKLVYYNQVPRPRRPCRAKARSKQHANDSATSSLDLLLYRVRLVRGEGRGVSD